MTDPDDLDKILKQLDKLFPSEVKSGNGKDVDYKIPFKNKPQADGLCPKCGKIGIFIRMTLCCKIHGPYAGC